MNICDALCRAKEILKEADIENYSFEVSLLLERVSGLSKLRQILEHDKSLDGEIVDEFFRLVEKRKTHHPLQYILGETEFMGLKFKVGEGCLIPRSDTEVLVEEIIKKASSLNLKTVLDIGVGSGCIAVSLAKLSDLSLTALDISPKALEFAKINNELNKTNVKFLESDLFSSLNNEKFDIIVSNPPYISKEEIPNLMKEVKDFEPLNALYGGIDGLDFYRRIIKESKYYLNKNGWLFFEIGYNQSGDIVELFKENNFINIEVVKDLAGLDRVVYAMDGAGY